MQNSKNNMEISDSVWDNLFLDVAKNCFIELYKRDPSSPMHISKVAINVTNIFVEQLKENLRCYTH